MDAKLVVAKGKTSVKEIPLPASKMIIGRRNNCTLCIPSPLVSRNHCELVLLDDRLLVKDLGSSNGTFVNGSRVREKELRSGDTLGVGPITFVVQLGSSTASPSDTVRPVGAEQADVDSDETADFLVNDEETTETADFIVSDDEGTPEDAADFVVSDDAVDSEEAAFIATDSEASDGETVHDVSFNELADSEEAASTQQDEAVPEEPAEEVSKPKKKPGFFGKLFGKKKGKEAKGEPQPAESPVTAEEKQPKSKGKSAPAAPPPRPAAAPDDDFIVQDEPSPGESSEKVNEDELADFLLGLDDKAE